MKIETIETHPELEAFYPVIEGVVKLFYPHVEGVVHDLRQGTVVALFNNFSKRKPGDRSPLKELGIRAEDFPDVFEPYMKINWDGKRLKCTSVTIRNSDGVPAGLICLNFDISAFDEIGQVLHVLQAVSRRSGNPADLSEDAWENKVRQFTQDYLNEQGLSQKQMTAGDKQTLVRLLYRKGYFNYKYAAKFISRFIGVSRATIYNYLKQDG
jgi:predicted transcriptional regulator YheO